MQLIFQIIIYDHIWLPRNFHEVTRMYACSVEVSKTQKDLALTNLTADLEDFFKTQVGSFNKEANGYLKAFEQVKGMPT